MCVFQHGGVKGHSSFRVVFKDRARQRPGGHRQMAAGAGAGREAGHF